MKSNLSEGWKEVKLGDITNKIGSGSTPRGGSKVYIQEGISFIRSQNVLDFMFSTNGLVNINADAAKKLNNVEILSNDILINITGDSVARACLVPDEILPARVNQHVSIIRTNENISYYKYVIYKLQALKSQLLSYASSGATRNALTKSMLENLTFNLPPLVEQQAIADTLSALDDKIELNNRTKENLEQQAQAIFKHWFVDFEFPDGNRNPYKSSGGEMIESELGMIPKGWEVGEINNYFEIAIGRTPPRKKAFYFSDKKEDTTWVSISDLGKAGVFISDSKEKLTDKSFEDFNIRKIPKDSVLMSFKLTVGRVAITNRELTTNEAIAHFINPEFYMMQYLYLYLKRFEFERLGNTSSIGTAVNSTIVKKMPFLNPKRTILDTFGKTINPVFENIRNLENQNDKLSQLRDILLPKLMSGELRIPLD